MVACRYRISLLVLNSTSYSWATSWTLEEKFHIDARPCILLYPLVPGKTLIFKNCSKVLHVKPNTWHMHSISTILQHPMYGFLLNKNFMIFQLLTWWNSGKTATLLEKHKWIENSFFAKTIVNCDLPDSQLRNFYSMWLTTTKRVTNCLENSAISFFFLALPDIVWEFFKCKC